MAFPSSVKALSVYADAFLYSSSAKGIVKQALTGVGKKYIAIAKELYKHPEWDSAVGCAFLGGFYNVAPWPVGSKSKATKFLREGAKLHPTRRCLVHVHVHVHAQATCACTCTCCTYAMAPSSSRRGGVCAHDKAS